MIFLAGIRSRIFAQSDAATEITMRHIGEALRRHLKGGHSFAERGRALHAAKMPTEPPVNLFEFPE
jgi:hypothetical protein